MKCINYFATFEESLEIVRDLTREDLEIIVEPELADAPEPTTFATVEDTLTSILETAPVFYLSGRFTRFGVAFAQMKSGEAEGKYAIAWHTQGPLIKGLMSRINQVDGAYRLLAGGFDYRDAYRNPETDAWEKPGPELKSAFNNIVKIVKTRCPRFAYKPGVEIYIGPEARARLESKAVHIIENQIIPGGLS